MVIQAVTKLTTVNSVSGPEVRSPWCGKPGECLVRLQHRGCSRDLFAGKSRPIPFCLFYDFNVTSNFGIWGNIRYVFTQQPVHFEEIDGSS